MWTFLCPSCRNRCPNCRFTGCLQKGKELTSVPRRPHSSSFADGGKGRQIAVMIQSSWDSDYGRWDKRRPLSNIPVSISLLITLN